MVGATKYEEYKGYQLINAKRPEPQIIQKMKCYYTVGVRNIKDKSMFSPYLKLHY